MTRFSKKVAIVTGAGSGIGKTTALMFAAEGASVVLADKDASATEAVARQVQIYSNSDRCLPFCCDISQENDVRNLIQASVHRFGRIDVLINNAAAFIMRGADQATVDDWKNICSVNIAGTAICSRYVADEMRRTGGGAIVVVSSISGIRADAGYATYSASKAALIMLTRSMAVDFGKWNIRVNSVSPGAVDTPALRRELERSHTSWQEFEEEICRQQCLPKVLCPDDIARAILFLASEDARLITGSNLVVDGGYLAGK